MSLRLWLVASTAFALGGCDFAPRYAPPHIYLPAKFQDAGPDGGQLPPNGAWWRSFRDRTLDDLQAQVDIANPDLAAAIAASDAAFAQAAEVEAGLLPQINAIGQITQNKQSNNRPLRGANEPNYYGNNILGAQVSYEIDIWGRVRDLAKAANLTAEASADALAEARLELHAELARAYIDLRGLDAQAKLLADTIGIYREALDLTKSRLAAQIASPVDVDRAQNQLSSAEAQATEVSLQRAALETAIAALVGKPAASFSVARSPASLPLPRPPRAVPVDVLRRRPDVAEQERLTAAASQNIGAARANFFPRFSLIALGGTQDTAFRLLNPGNTFGTIGPAVDFPLFDAGLRQAELEVAKDQFTQAAELYRSVVLRAIKEVEDNLSGLRYLAVEYTQAATSAKAAQDAANLSMTLYRDGASSFLDVVTAQQAALEAERLTIILHTRQLESVIGLMLALGGGWVVPPPQPLQPIDYTPTPVQLVKDISKARP